MLSWNKLKSGVKNRVLDECGWEACFLVKIMSFVENFYGLNSGGTFSNIEGFWGEFTTSYQPTYHND